MWKEIDNTGYYISNEGQVKNSKDRILKGDLNSKGYRRVQINSKHLMIHRLVGIYFVPNPDNKPQINHIDYNKLNNHYSNLEWMTNQENNAHSFTKGRISGNTKLSIDALKDVIHQLSLPGYNVKQLADKYNVSKLTIYAIKQGYNRKRLML